MAIEKLQPDTVAGGWGKRASQGAVEFKMLKDKLSIDRNDLIPCAASSTPITGGPTVIFQNPR